MTEYKVLAFLNEPHTTLVSYTNDEIVINLKAIKGLIDENQELKNKLAKYEGQDDRV